MTKKTHGKEKKSGRVVGEVSAWDVECGYGGGVVMWPTGDVTPSLLICHESSFP